MNHRREKAKTLSRVISSKFFLFFPFNKFSIRIQKYNFEKSLPYSDFLGENRPDPAGDWFIPAETERLLHQRYGHHSKDHGLVWKF